MTKESDSYKHLLRYNQTPNIPCTPPNAPVVLFARNTFLNYRPYESFEAILRYLQPCVFKKNVLVSLEHFREKYTPLQARKMYRMITGQRFENEDPRDIHSLVWNHFQNRGLVVMKVKTQNNGRNSFLFDLEKLGSTNQKFPKQCRVIIQALLDKQVSAYTHSELQVFANDLHKYGLKTRQKPFLIVQYYLSKLHDAGLVEYPRKQYDKGDDDE